jgi:hypothetical protein
MQKHTKRKRTALSKSRPKPLDHAKHEAIAHILNIDSDARFVETIMADGVPVWPAEVRLALSGLLLELSNEASIYYHTPGVAAAFYRTAVLSAELLPGLSWAGKTALRHLRVLLDNPNKKTAKAISAFWDVPGSNGPDKDPFPEKPAARRKGGAR